MKIVPKYSLDGMGWFLSGLQALSTGIPIYLCLWIASVQSPGSIKTSEFVALISVPCIISLIISLNRESRTARDRRLERVNIAVEKADFNKIIHFTSGAIVGDFKDRNANVMLIQGETPQVLRIIYQRGLLNKIDNKLLWEKHEGCCGRAWANGKLTLVDLSKVNKEQMHNEWGMTELQITCTKSIRSVISLPIRNATNSDIKLGVLNCDSRKLHVPE